ncbi:hypothetical protein MYAER_3209 [Microcystis aeruginosa NIES-2549]|uniref:Uncharacterized protein n=1 Tax=Microcystis aeruginosa NIES-2549 TaxID=1641812 RepID=A0A0F6U5R1_MICAE|nr:hypothetical protein MYAER_3209 [Microcystis aeruginosa NIES-2549]AOC53961.1 hypothetical protein amyaer_3256 [Microcystis aeruginosa NIES-2481]
MVGLGVSYQLSVISYQFTEKTPHFPTSHTLHPLSSQESGGIGSQSLVDAIKYSGSVFASL